MGYLRLKDYYWKNFFLNEYPALAGSEASWAKRNACVCAFCAFKPSLGLGLNSVYKIYLKGYWQEWKPQHWLYSLPTSLYRDNTILVQWPFFFSSLGREFLKILRALKKIFKSIAGLKLWRKEVSSVVINESFVSQKGHLQYLEKKGRIFSTLGKYHI